MTTITGLIVTGTATTDDMAKALLLLVVLVPLSTRLYRTSGR